ncbi:MAG: DNA polymerase III subunit beta [Candidatus Levybacteria bacterium RIFCSPHIGHO2_01_FULL_37_17]|nr:MAG: DNA polymerase III subunit beta [Candidatus Levybacteria bacterium RIFCSPHIGHO2_01_FULL_37_17]OGH36437.1 MAG: DNA polymerase III subunit beta [Candidatus Levybacteria bacterium RIFCSPLOWO2_01_FULL_38_23]
MLVSLLSDKLLEKITLLNHAVSQRAPLPILSSFLLEATKGKLIISATDLEVGIKAEIAASVEKGGKITVPAKNFLDLITNIKDQKITLELEDNVLKLKGVGLKASFQTSQPEDFPKLYEQKGDEILRLQKKDAEKFFKRVSFAAATDSTRPALLGVLFEIEKDGLVLVATDQYRLSYQKTPLKLKHDLEKPVVVPGRIVKELSFLKDDKEDIIFYLSLGNNQVVVSQGDVEIVGRLIDADYPEYQKIMPEDANTKTEIDREQLLNAIRICSVFARETANIVKFSLEKDKLTVSANSPQVGEDLVEIEAKTIGEDNEIAFNAKYLIDVLTTLEENDLVFEMTGPLNSGVFKVQGDNSFLHLVMPIRIQG